MIEQKNNDTSRLTAVDKLYNIHFGIYGDFTKIREDSLIGNITIDESSINYEIAAESDKEALMFAMNLGEQIYSELKESFVIVDLWDFTMLITQGWRTLYELELTDEGWK